MPMFQTTSICGEWPLLQNTRIDALKTAEHTHKYQMPLVLAVELLTSPTAIAEAHQCAVGFVVERLGQW